MAAELFLYFVEGECEKVFIKAFQHTDCGAYRFKPGRVEVLNFNYEKISSAKAMLIKKNTKVVIVFDTDVRRTKVFENNLDTLYRFANIDYNDIIFIPSIKNFEDEILFSCSQIKSINQLFETDNVAGFKSKFIKHRDLVSKLLSVGFDMSKMWARDPRGPYEEYKNLSYLTKEKN